MGKIIITSGKKFIDVDSLSCALALRDLLILEGKKAETVLVGELNHSVTDNIRKMGMDFLSKFTDNENEDLILVDVSEPNQLPESVDLKKVIEIYDHHVGFEKFWQEKIGDKAKIESVGACATLIWEEYKKRGMKDKIDSKNVNLLMMAIVSNTLNFKASITSQRDEMAFAELKKHAEISEEQIKGYFLEQERSIEDDVKKSIINDTKVQNIFGTDIYLVIGQIELWDGKDFVKKYLEEIEEVLVGFSNPNYFMTVPSISEGKNYFYTKSETVKVLLKRAVDAKFDGNIGSTPKLWLRKEILEKMYQLSKIEK